MDAQALGRYLRQSREAKELTLEDAEQALRIRIRILEAFELGDFQIQDASPVQITGFIRNYARFLGLDENLVIQYYEAVLVEDAQRERRKARRGGSARKKRTSKREANNGGIPIAPRSITDTKPKLPIPPPLPTTGLGERTRAGTGIFGWVLRLFVAVASVAVIVFVASQLINLEGGFEVGATAAPGIFAQLPPTDTITPAPSRTPIPPSPVPEGLQQLYSGQGVLVTIQFRQRSWVRLLTDGAERYTGVAEPGTILEYPAQSRIDLTASNAESLEVVYNGALQPSFGDRGQRVDVVFTDSGIQITTGPGFEPTAIFSDTPMPTPTDAAGGLVAQLTPSDTPGPSATASDTPTITNTPTITLTPSSTYTPSPSPTITSTPTMTLTPTNTFTATNTATITPIPSNTPVPTNTLPPSPTAILPPRVTPTGQPPPK